MVKMKAEYRALPHQGFKMTVESQARSVGIRITTVVALLPPVLALTCCSDSKPGPIETKIAAKISACKDQAPCRIVMSEITDFQWDRMYAFKYVATLEQVQQALGTPPPQHTEFTRKIVFLNYGTVVYMEEVPANVEHRTAGEVSFDIPDSAVYRAYDRERAVFLARKETEEAGVIYELESTQ
jgi:hypothetical protein